MSIYLERYAYFKEALIKEKPEPTLFLTIVIPCFNEPEICSTLTSLINCTLPKKSVEIIIVVNNAENSSQEILSQNNKTINEIKQFKTENKCNHHLKIHIIQALLLPKKYAGVGLARKIGMDEAVRRNPNGVIICLDADSLVEKNYLSVHHH